jgi:uncharacterized protein
MSQMSNCDTFTRMLSALGTKDYDTFEGYLDCAVLCEWPYKVIDGFPTRLVGARRLRELLETSLTTFTPYNYSIEVVHALVDPSRLIAEYTSHSTYLPRNVPYSNQYVGILDFRDAKVTRWREYVNPLTVLEALGTGLVWQEGKGATRRS